MSIFGKKRRALSVALTCMMAFTSMSPLQAFAADNTVTFSRDGSGKPIFDGVPAHLKAFTDVVLADMSDEDLAYYADQKAAASPKTIQAGYTLPATAAGGVDRVMGTSTDMPSMLGLGQSWNKNLVNKVGSVIGDERRGEVNASDPNTLMFSAVSDLRINPLSGRFDEGYSEDPVLSGTMVNAMSEGITGYGQNGNTDGFWLKAQLGTKHFTNYLAQWFRTTGQFEASSRALSEYQMKSFLYPLNKGLVTSIMTTYGRTNGVPNHISPNIVRAKNASPYALMPVGDFVSADGQMTDGFNNGYQNYTDAEGKAALLLLSGNHANAFGSTKADILSAVNKGIFGVGRKELEDAVRGQIEMWVRTGYFGGGTYPFTSLAKDKNPVNFSSPENQQVALDAAHESIVLLKNNGILPLNKASINKLAVTGPLADARFKSTYSVSTTPDIENSGISTLGAIQKVIGADKVTYGTGSKIVAFESKVNSGIVTASQTEAGAQVTVTTESIITVMPPVLPITTGSVFVAGGKTYTKDQAFEVYAWGQDGYSYKSLANNKWLNYATTTYTPWGQAQQTVRPDLALMNDDSTSLNLTTNSFSNVSTGTSLPGRLRKEVNNDGTTTLLAETYSESFMGGFETSYYQNGRFITVNPQNALQVSGKLKDIGASNRTDAEKFNEITLKAVGADAEVWKTDNDYAIVVVGAPTRHSAGEGADRSSLDLGKEQYELITNVSNAFPGKTIVIVKSNFPVTMKEVQDNNNVSAILYQPYAGQYDSKALADVLFGDYAPTGRLTSTWYASTGALPAIDKYSLPQGAAPDSLDEIDPRFTVDMTNGDPAQTGLTYMYTDAEVTYPFGYGLGYSNFSFSNLSAPSSVSGKEPFTVSVNVTNTGSVDTSEVVQLYIKNNSSAYGQYMPKKQLAAYEKVTLGAGQTKTVTLTVNPADFAVWDINSGKYVTESGDYTLMAGKSSKDSDLITAGMSYTGESISKLDALTKAVNVFDSSFASKDVAYREVSKLRTAEGLKNKASQYGYYAVMSKASDAWTALNQVKLDGVKSITLNGASENGSSNIEVRQDSPAGNLLATITIGQTGKATRDIPGRESEALKVEELDFTAVTADLSQAASGTHNLYLVFKNADARVDSIKLNDVTKNALAIATKSLASGTVGTSYTQTLTSTGVTGTLTWLAEGLPAGLTLDQNTGVISGTPTAAGTFNVKVTLKNGETVISDTTLNLTISQPSSGGSSSGGGSSNTTPATPATPAVPGITPATPAVPAVLGTKRVSISLTSGIASNGGESFKLSVKPFVQNGRTMVGVRDVTRVISGSSIVWNAKAKKIVIKSADKVIELTIAQKAAIVNGQRVTMDTAPQIKNGSTVLPIANIAKILGLKADFNENTKEAIFIAQ